MINLPEVGQVVADKKLFSQHEFNLFADLSGDDNPIHVDPEFSAQTRFGRTVAHGMLLYGVICGLLSRHFPGTVQIEHALMFPGPTYTGEEMTVQAEVTAVLPAQRQARLVTVIIDPRGEITCQGETVLQWRPA